MYVIVLFLSGTFLYEGIVSFDIEHVGGGGSVTILFLKAGFV